MRIRGFALVCCVVAAGLVTQLPASADASRRPTAAEEKRISDAVSRYFSWCSRCRFRATRIKVSSADPRFATAFARATRARQPLQGAQVLLWRGTKRWAVIDYGSDLGIGCDFVSAAVRKDLFGSANCP
jgi:hypothetical protein